MYFFFFLFFFIADQTGMGGFPLRELASLDTKISPYEFSLIVSATVSMVSTVKPETAGRLFERVIPMSTLAISNTSGAVFFG